MPRSARALVVELVADTKDFVKGTQKADTTLSDFVRDANTDLDHLARQTDTNTEKMARSFDNLEREARTSFHKLGDSAGESGREAFGEAGKESAGEFASNLSETLSSGDFTALGTDTAAGLVAGFASMPGLGPALAVVAGGAAVLFGKIAKDAQNAAETVRQVFEAAASDAIAKMNETVRGGAFVTFMTQLGSGDPAKGMQKLAAQAEKAGISFQTVRDAYIAGGQPLQDLLTKLDQVQEKTSTAGTLSRAHKNAIAETNIEAGKLHDTLAEQNKLIDTGIGKQVQLNSLYGDDHIATAVGQRTDELRQQKTDLNSMAAAQDRINASLIDPRITAAISERTRMFHAAELAASAAAAAVRGAPGTVVGGRRN